MPVPASLSGPPLTAAQLADVLAALGRPVTVEHGPGGEGLLVARMT
jgi:hypothetical protein